MKLKLKITVVLHIKMSLLTTIDNRVALAVTLFVNCLGSMSLLNT